MGNMTAERKAQRVRATRARLEAEQRAAAKADERAALARARVEVLATELALIEQWPTVPVTVTARDVSRAEHIAL